MTIWRMCIECCITKATHTHTHTICNAYCFSTATTVARTRLNVTFIRTLRVLFIVPVVCEPFTHKQDCIATLVLSEAEVLVTAIRISSVCRLY